MYDVVDVSEVRTCSEERGAGRTQGSMNKTAGVNEIRKTVCYVGKRGMEKDGRCIVGGGRCG